jgi:hypothetical protein
MDAGEQSNESNNDIESGRERKREEEDYYKGRTNDELISEIKLLKKTEKDLIETIDSLNTRIIGLEEDLKKPPDAPISANFDVGLLFYLPNEVLFKIFSNFLSLKELSRFDSALCNKVNRFLYLECIESESCTWQGDKHRKIAFNAMFWLHTRSIKVRDVYFVSYVRTDNTTLGSRIRCIKGNCPQLNTITLSDCKDLIDIDVIKIAENCPHLNTLNLFSGCGNITERSILMIGNSCPNLHNLDSEGGITDSSLIGIAEGCPQLRSLSTTYNGSVTDVSIISLAEKCPKLNSLNLRNCIHITDASIIRLSESCPDINSLNLRNCIHITDASIIRLSESCPDIHTLQTYNCHGVTIKLKRLKIMFPNLKYFV